MGDGPFIRALDKALASFHVQRQAYYSGAFVGNHVHSTLKVIQKYTLCEQTHMYNQNILQPSNTATLCSSIVEVAKQHAASLVPQTQEIGKKFERAFSLFHDCHAIYDSKIVTNEDILKLGKHF